MKNIFYALSILLLFRGCNDNDVPELPEEEEIITDVRLIFNPESGTPKVFYASDPDGEGPKGIEVSGAIELETNTIYTLFIEVENTIQNADITGEIEAEGVNHQFYFEFTVDLFDNPKGNGNFDEPGAGVVDYQDEDVNGLPLGLITRWRTGEAINGTFRVILKHQPGLKTDVSTSRDGETDIDITWSLSIL